MVRNKAVWERCGTDKSCGTRYKPRCAAAVRSNRKSEDRKKWYDESLSRKVLVIADVEDRKQDGVI